MYQATQCVECGHADAIEGCGCKGNDRLNLNPCPCASETVTTEQIHVFERAGLGIAPFRFVGMHESRGPITLADGSQIGAPGQPMGTCDFCGTGIAIICTIQGADGRRFKVGNVCVGKAGDEGLRKVVDEAVRERRNAHARERNTEKREAEWARVKAAKLEVKAVVEKNADALAAMPHPYGFEGKTALDFATYMLDNGGAPALSKVKAQLKKAALNSEGA